MGKSVSTPAVPDYTAAAKEQGVANQQAALQSATLSNPNMITPYGTQTVSYSKPTFDESGYNQALQDYQTKSSAIDKNAFMRPATYSGGGEGTGETPAYFDQSAYNLALKNAGAAPDRAAFTTAGGVPTVTQTLTPTAQATTEAQQRVQRALAGLGEVGLQNASNVLSTPFTPTTTDIVHSIGAYDRARANTQADTYGLAKGEVPLQYSLDTSNLAAMPINAGTTAQDLILQRLNPTITAGDTSFRQQLANQGLAPGTQAYDTAYRNREMSKNDLYNQAALQGINLDMAARQQGLNEQNLLGTFGNTAQLQGAGLYNQAVGQNFGQGVTADQLYNQSAAQNFNQQLQAAQFQNSAQQQQLAQDLALRSQPLQEIIGLMGGSQIQLPQFSGYQGAGVQAAPMFNATQAQYQGALGQSNAQNASNAQAMQGLFGLGAAALMAPTGTFSDRRLKTDIKHIAKADNGLNIYSYKYVWGGSTQLGYMADEVEKIMPEAIGEFNGYKTVNYGMI